MRKEYKICVEAAEIPNVENSLNHLKIASYTKSTGVDSSTGTTKYVYRVHLSKYELLYLRLTCNTGTLKKIIVPKLRKEEA